MLPSSKQRKGRRRALWDALRVEAGREDGRRRYNAGALQIHWPLSVHFMIGWCLLSRILSFWHIAVHVPVANHVGQRLSRGLSRVTCRSDYRFFDLNFITTRSLSTVNIRTHIGGIRRNLIILAVN